jgi:hypothetical protein
MPFHCFNLIIEQTSPLPGPGPVPAVRALQVDPMTALRYE